MTQTLRVLIVDNQARARNSMKALLNAWQMAEEVREAANGEQAIAEMGPFHPDLVLIDVRMPRMNGLDATRIIKEKWPETKIIALSMYPEFASEALAAGADAFVSKNDPPEKLRKTLVTLMVYP